MLASRFVRKLGELANQLLEYRPHLRIADGFRVQIDVGKLLGDQIKEPGFGKPINLGMEVKAFKDVAHGR